MKKPDMNLILLEAESKHGLSYTSTKFVLGQMIKEKEILVSEKGSHLINSKSKPVNKKNPLEIENSKLEDASFPGIINVRMSKDEDTSELHPNLGPPTVNTANAVLGNLGALAKGVDNTSQLLHQEQAFSEAL